MSRPLRIELADGPYHVTSRGDRREDIYADEADRLAWLEVFGQVQPTLQLGLPRLVPDEQPLPRHRGDG